MASSSDFGLAVLGIAVTMMFWGVDKLLESVGNLERYPWLAKVLKYMTFVAGLVYFGAGLYILYLLQQSGLFP